MSKHTVPSFYLYGEAPRLVHKDFVHVEALVDRSRPSEWTIQPHAHFELNHIFVLLSGGGAMKADGALLRIEAPGFLLVPASTVHGFEWLEDSEGFVVTVGSSYVADLNAADETLADLFARPRAVGFAAGEVEHVRRIVADLVRELNWTSVGHRAAVSAAMLSLLVAAIRSMDAPAAAGARAGAHASTVARLRERIERRFRLREPISSHAAALGVSETALRAACAKVAGRSPGEMLDERALLEAQRALLYTNLSVSEIGFSVGFADPAYFSRFFQRKLGLPPRAYRTKFASRAVVLLD